MGKDKMNQLAQLFKALSEETRLRIIMLLTYGELCVCDLMVVLDEPQSKVSRHLAYLKHSGMTNSKRVGVWMHYWLNDSENRICKSLIDFLKEHLSHLPQFRGDMERLLELKKHGDCKATMKLKKRRRTEKKRGEAKTFPSNSSKPKSKEDTRDA